MEVKAGVDPFSYHFTVRETACNRYGVHEACTNCVCVTEALSLEVCNSFHEIQAGFKVRYKGWVENCIFLQHCEYPGNRSLASTVERTGLGSAHTHSFFSFLTLCPTVFSRLSVLCSQRMTRRCRFCARLYTVCLIP